MKIKLSCLFLALSLGASSLFGAGLFHTESLDTDPSALTGELVPTPSTQAAIKTIDVVGDTLSAVGVPFAGFAGEAVTALSVLAAVLLNAARSRNKKALVTVVQGVKEKTTNGDIKKEISKRSKIDGTKTTIDGIIKVFT
jgi:hypothetical protein